MKDPSTLNRGRNWGIICWWLTRQVVSRAGSILYTGFRDQPPFVGITQRVKCIYLKLRHAFIVVKLVFIHRFSVTSYSKKAQFMIWRLKAGLDHQCKGVTAISHTDAKPCNSRRGTLLQSLELQHVFVHASKHPKLSSYMRISAKIICRESSKTAIHGEERIWAWAPVLIVNVQVHLLI